MSDVPPENFCIDIGSTGISAYDGRRTVIYVNDSNMEKTDSSFVLEVEDGDNFVVHYIGPRSYEVAKSMKGNIFVCYNLKKALYEGPGVFYARSVHGGIGDFKENDIEEIFVRYIVHILGKIKGHVKDHEIFRTSKFVFTVPPVWRIEHWQKFWDICKRALTEMSVKRASIVAPEPMAAAVDLIKDLEGFTLRPGIRILSIDVGGFTTDFSLLETTSNGMVSIDVDLGDYRPVGSNKINENFLQVIEELFGKHFDAIEACHETWSDLNSRFESFKTSREQRQDLIVDLSYLASKIMVPERDIIETVRSNLGRGKFGNTKVDGEQKQLVFERNFLVKEVFEPVYREFEELCVYALDKFKVKQSDFKEAVLLISGGFSLDDRIREIARNVFGCVRMQTSEEPQYCVAKGGLVLGAPATGTERFNMSLGMKIGNDEKYSVLVKADDPIAMLRDAKITIMDLDEGKSVPFSLAKLDDTNEPICVFTKNSHLHKPANQKFIRLELVPSMCELEIKYAVGGPGTTFAIPYLCSTKIDLS